MPAPSRSLALVTKLRPTLLHATNAVLGGVLELVVHSIEDLRDRLGRVPMR
jgi:hypothetical protein